MASKRGLVSKKMAVAERPANPVAGGMAAAAYGWRRLRRVEIGPGTDGGGGGI